MNLDHLLQVFFQNNSLIIEVIVVAIIILMAIMVYLMIKKGPEAEGSNQLFEIEETLKKVLAQAENLPKAPAAAQASTEEGEAGAAPAEGAVSAAPGASPEQIAELQKIVDEQKQKIATLESQAPAEGGGDDAKLKELNEKIAFLESQIKEYEIIEDDIADLSLFKEENASLKKELDALKGGAPAPAPEPAAEVAPEPAPEPTPEPTAEAAPEAAPAPEPVPESAADAAPAPTPAPEEKQPESNFTESKVDSAEEYITDDILAEFSAAIDKEFGHATDKEERKEKSNVPEEKPSETAAADPQSAVDQAMKAAEAVKGVRDEAAAAAEPAAAKVDTDKMLEEMADLSKVDEAAADNSLEESTDLEKMAAEATNLTDS